jgi:transcriptional regulator with XRE-family HTH domain
MEQAAQQAGIHRVTLQRWERGRAQPRLSELGALLGVLDVSAQQKRHALGLMEAPRATRQIHQEVTRIAKQRGMVALPHGGDLLHALRMRKGLSLEEAARRVQVTGGTLRRWEKMEVWPSIEQLHRLCYALEAQEEEIIALTVGRFSRMPRLEKTSLEAVQERLLEITMLEETIPGGYPLFELAYLQMEADAWPLALRSEAGKQMLINTYAHHAHGFSLRERLEEAGSVAERALELMGDTLKPISFWMYPVFISARSRVFRGEHLAPKRGLEILRPWLSVAQWPVMQAWLLADMAKYLGLSGEPEVALTLAEEACRVAVSTGNEVELCLRKWDKASLLMQAGRPGEALALVEERGAPEDQPHCHIDVSLLRAEAYMAVGDRTQASDWLQRAVTDIDTYHIEYKRPRAECLLAQL